MGNPKAFLTINRKEAGYRPIEERKYDFSEVEQTLNPDDRRQQASRCMDCGVPFCHWACPLGNKQPDWQDLLYKGKWKEAYEVLELTNDFPEFTGRVCPALCEKSCVLNLSSQPVTIRENEAAIAERAFSEDFIQPFKKINPSRFKVAVVGSGPSGLAAANQLNKMGHNVTVFEKNEYAGGLLRLGIPDFKLSKKVVERRLNLMKAEGVEFKLNTKIGEDIKASDLLKDYDAICIAIGSEHPRDLNAPGRELKGVYFALELLRQQNRVVAGEVFDESERITAKGKHVLVIGGGDTGSDCVGTSIRQGAEKVTQIEIMPKPPVDFNPKTPWPMYPMILKTSSSHKEGCERRWCLDTKQFIGKDGRVVGVEVEEVEWKTNEQGAPSLVRTGKVETIKADIVLLAMGFIHPVHEGLISELNLALDKRGNIQTDDKQLSSVSKVFAAGDAKTGASLVVRSIDSGRKAAKAIDAYLKSL
ncbi:MAG: glutamate synthase subunit beta [Bacteroidales bacterium]|nr:glutamate synthase subunit beta [Bacteroidales bacterium]